jgi:hypothetical protein
VAALTKLTESPTPGLATPQLSVHEAPNKSASTPSVNEPTNEAVGIIEKAINAAGGREVLSKFKISKQVSTATGIQKGNSYFIRSTVFMQIPDLLKVDQEIMNSGRRPTRNTICVFPDRVFVPPVFGLLPRKISSEDETRLRDTMYIGECASLLPLLNPGVQLERLASSPVSGTIAIKVSKPGKPVLTLLFGVDTGYLVGVDYNRRVTGGLEQAMSVRYSEFSEFSGRKVAAREQYSEGATVASSSRIESWEPIDVFPDTGAASRAGSSTFVQTPNSTSEPASGGIEVSIQGGQISIGSQRQSYQPVTFELSPGDYQDIAFRRKDNPGRFRMIQVQLSKDGKQFFFDPGMKQIRLVDDGWQFGRTYYPSEIKDGVIYSGAKDIQIKIRSK